MRLGVSNLRPPVIRDYGDALALIQRGRPLKNEPGVTPLTGRRRRNNLVAVDEGDRISVEYGYKTMASFHKDGWLRMHEPIGRDRSPEALIHVSIGRQGLIFYADDVCRERYYRIHHGGLVCYTRRDPVRVHTTDPVDLSKIATVRFRGILPNAAKTKAYLKEIGWYEFAAWADMVEKIGREFDQSYAALGGRSERFTLIVETIKAFGGQSERFAKVVETIKARDVANYEQALSLIHTLGGFRSVRTALLDETELTGDEATIGPVMTDSNWLSFIGRARRLEAIPV